MAAVQAPGRTGVRRELRGAVVIAVAVLLGSVLGGVVWGWLAPTEQLFVVEPGRGTTLTGESAHQFDAVALFLCIGAVVGVLSAIGAWRWRAVRGPLFQLGLLIGSGAGAVVMARLGEQVAAWQHPRPHNPPVGQIVSLPIELGSELALIVQPLLASLIVLFLAALSASDDLGTGFRGPFGDSAPVGARSFHTPGTVEPPVAESPAGAASGVSLPHGSYEPAGEACSGSSAESRPSR